MDNFSIDSSSTSQYSYLPKKTVIVIIALLLCGFVATFISGFYLSDVFSREKPTAVIQNELNPSPTETPTEANDILEEIQESTNFIPGMNFFDDTIMLVSKQEPHISLIATATRHQNEQGYTQNTRVSYFNGNDWARKLAQNATSDSAIVSNALFKRWEIDINKSRVLKQRVDGEILIGGDALAFSTSELENEIGMRSLPGYTKFMSNGSGTLKVNGNNLAVHVLYTRIYSLNSADIQFYNQPLGLTTDWVAFWDNQGNFYHIDNTQVDRPTPIYESHQIGVLKSADSSVLKSFSLEVQRDGNTPPTDYVVNIHNPIRKKLRFSLKNNINKSSNKSMTWFMGSIAGTVIDEASESTIEGFGLVEYIHNQ